LPAPDADTSLSSLSVLDWIGILVVGASGLFALAVPVLIAPMFRHLSESLGVTTSSLSSSLLQGWVPAVVGALPLLVLGYALAVPQNVMRRRMFIVLAFALTVLAGVLLLFAFYGTLFAAAGAAAGS
jgi:hypothetical protein